jgi:mono/diheme cytochrome c family protein
MAQLLWRRLSLHLRLLIVLVPVTAAWGQAPNRQNGSTVWFKPAPGQSVAPAGGFEFLPEPNNDAALFQTHCTTCHDADRSLKKKKSLSEWRATVQKMAAKEDADIPERVREPIALYLAAHAGSDGRNPEPSALNGLPSAAPAKEKENDKTSAEKSALIQQGQAAFNSTCTTCHDAEKSLQKSKSLSAWRATVARMAAKDGAHIPDSTHEAIATYLASLGSKGKGENDQGGGADSGLPVTITGTLSAMYRGSGDPNLENPGHFGDAWLGLAWQPKGPVSGRVTTCISCHSQGFQLGNSLELVEASLRLDVNKCLCPDKPDALPVKFNVEAGRFVVPFGAYYQQVNPGVDRAVSKPLIYNMGQRVDLNDIGDPVLPMPYSDQGASLNLDFTVCDTINVTMNSYVVNALKGNDFGINFFQSRDYLDNNRWPAVGGRVTVGGSNLRLGTSIMGGRFNSDAGSGPQNEGLNYLIFGADAAYHWKDILRVQFEYADRQSERYDAAVAPAVFSEHVSGFYLEGELLVCRDRHISLFTRYERQLHESPLPPLGSQITTGSFGVDRYTYGVNWTLPGGSLLMINDEIWNLPQGLGTVNVVGMRWAATF